MTARVSIIVPTLNEAAALPSLLASLAACDAHEIIVVDGASTDGTAALARAHGARLMRSARGRGVQLHAGAEAATGDAFIFLHADTRLPPGAVEAVRAALASPDVAGGAFRLRFDARHPLLTLYAAAARLETPLTTFGDQAFFVRRDVYAQAGGFPPWPILEDVELRRRLKRLGRFVKLRSVATTSARRFQADGAFRRQARNGWILLQFALGASPARLSERYPPR